MKNKCGICWGLFLVILGIVIGLKSLNIIDFNIFFDGWWTLFIIVPSIISILTDDNKCGGVISLIVGILLLLACNDFIDMGLLCKLLFPAIIIIVGLSLLFKGLFPGKDFDNFKGIKRSGKDYLSLFSGNEEKIIKGFNGCNILSIFGGTSIDISEATIKDDCVISTVNVFGGTELNVSDDVNVEVKSITVFGSVDNKAKESKNKNAKTVYVEAVCIFGGLDIK